MDWKPRNLVRVSLLPGPAQILDGVLFLDLRNETNFNGRGEVTGAEIYPS
jgi:hypothetical protein